MVLRARIPDSDELAAGHEVAASCPRSRDAPYAPEPLDPLLDVPTAPAAVDARALEELVAMVRPLDQLAHAAYDAWSRGEPYDFAEPQALSLGG